MEKINLFCLPFAGGNKYSYRKYEEKSPPFINLIPLEYPGRGSRVQEPLLGDVTELLDDLYQQIKSRVDRGSYAIYGHSMGGLMACLLARKVIENGHSSPLHLFITGTTGPSALSRKDKKRHLLGKKEFMEEVKSLNGTLEDILQNEELLEYLEPILRADFKVIESYNHTEIPPLDIAITVITGTQEDMTMEDIYLWQKETSAAVNFIRMPGNHFFINQYPFEIIQVIARKLVGHTKTYAS
ncbi:MAG: thioesterase domain-containing protein [Bacteroidota bacterium]